jgi:AcrR family transcriptional regulator
MDVLRAVTTRSSAPGRTRTCDLVIRSDLLCPAELRRPGAVKAYRRGHASTAVRTHVHSAAMAVAGSGPKRAPRRRKPLTRQRIVETAIELIERDGVDALSMRVVAEQLGAGTMSLYNHVTNKGDLLDAVAEYVLSLQQIPERTPGEWREDLRRNSLAMREVALRFPRTFPIVSTRHLSEPDAIRPLEFTLRTLHLAGFEGPALVTAMRTFVAYVTGALLREVNAMGGSRPGNTDPILTPVARYVSTTDLAPDAYPTVMAYADQFSVCDHEAEYIAGMNVVMDGMSALIASSQIP